MGLAGTAAQSGIAVAAFELHAVYTLAMLGWLFLPVYRATGVFTLPEYMYKRFGGSRIRIYLAIMSLMLYVFTKVGLLRLHVFFILCPSTYIQSTSALGARASG